MKDKNQLIKEFTATITPEHIEDIEPLLVPLEIAIDIRDQLKDIAFQLSQIAGILHKTNNNA